MPYNGSGVFTRLYNWSNDAIAGIKIRADRFDNEMNGMATGLSTAITKDGQTTVTADLPMAGFNHVNVGAAANRAEYTRHDQTQDGTVNWADGGGTANAITATYSPAVSTLIDGQECYVRATAANSTTTPTFSPNGLTARTIVKNGNVALVAGDISGDGHELHLRYRVSDTKWELLNPALNLIDEDNMASNTDLRAPTQQSVKAYVDANQLRLPVGSIYINRTNSTNPATLLGYGTWVAIADVMIIGASGTYPAGTTGGAATVSLTAANNGPHTHDVLTFDNANTGTRVAQGVSGGAGTYTTTSSGSGTPFSILPPYLACYMWERTV